MSLGLLGCQAVGVLLLMMKRTCDLRQRRSFDLNHRVRQSGTWERGSARWQLKH